MIGLFALKSNHSGLLPRLTVINKSYWQCSANLAALPKTRLQLGSLFHPQGLAWPLPHNTLELLFSSRALQRLSRARVFSCSLRGEVPVVASRVYWHVQMLWVGCRVTLCSWGASATCSPSHTQPSHTVLRDWPALAQQLPFIAFCGNSVNDIVIQAPCRNVFWSIHPSHKWDRWKQEKPGACATTRQFVNCILSVYLKAQNLSLVWVIYC